MQPLGDVQVTFSLHILL